MPVLRAVKNIVKNHTDAEVKVREATSNDPWGPSSTLMAEIADLTYNVVAFTEIMAMIWKRLNDHGKNWRHVYKSLTLLEYIMKTGSEKVAQQCKENIFAIQTLKDFQHTEDNKDLGANVREKAKALVALLKDDERLKNERSKALKAKERFAENFGIGSDQSQTQLGRPKHRHALQDLNTPKSELEEARPHSANEEELQLQLALAMSKEEAEADAKKKQNDDLKLQLALEESKKEEEEKSDMLKRQQNQRNTSTLLDFGGAGASAAAANDPWSSVPAPSSAGDPWGARVSPVKQNNASPFSPLGLSAPTDPWAPSAQTLSNGTVSYNPWESTAPAPSGAADIWSDKPIASLPPSSNSPWDVPAQNNKPAQKTLAIDDDFDALGLRTTQPGKPQAEPLFSMGSLGSTLPPIQMQSDSKKSEFLDSKAKTLVNLDSLVTKPKTSAGVVNPFAMTRQGQGATTAVATNPFLASQPPAPSLNQMSSNAPMTNSFVMGQPYVNPMMPNTMGYPGFAPVHQPMYPAQPTAYNSNNPFL